MQNGVFALLDFKIGVFNGPLNFIREKNAMNLAYIGRFPIVLVNTKNKHEYLAQYIYTQFTFITVGQNRRQTG